MKKNIVNILFCSLFIVMFSSVWGQNQSIIEKEQVLQTMKKAAEYMVNNVSCNGGYLWKYTEDLAEREGEAPARETQIMVMGGTTEMGHLFLDIYDATGDKDYLEYAQKAADALIYGQHPLGGWNYLIDFDQNGLEEWYEKVACKFRCGMEEYRHYYGNCTFDDNTTQGATTYLLRFYMTTLEAAYLEPLKKAIDFILISQYPNGGWPQRYPLRYEFVHDGLPDYTSCYTLNDNAMSSTITLLLQAYEQLGDERYLEAARRGGDFFMIAQGPKGQGAWAEQYDMNLQPCWARTHEAPGYMVRQTINTIATLEELYLFTGDRRYLRPIPEAFNWLEASGLKKHDNGDTEFARMYEPGTNKPIAVDLLEKRNELGYDLYNFYSVDKQTYLDIRKETTTSSHVVLWQVNGAAFRYKLDKLKLKYEEIKAADKNKRSKLYNELSQKDWKQFNVPDDQVVSNLLRSVNSNGVWINDINLWDKQTGQLVEKRKQARGIDIGEFISNMEMLLTYVK